jgi:type II secretory pathway component PulF
MALPHRTLASWYTQLAQQVDAGVALADAMKLSAGGATQAGATVAAVIGRGGTLDHGLRAAARWLPMPDLLTISAAARIGRLPAALRSLAERHARLHAVTRRLMLACAYPAVLVHVGILLFGVARMIDWQKGFFWDPIAYARNVTSVLVPLWIAIVAVIIAVRRWPAAAFVVGNWLPAVGGYLRAQALADLAFVLSGFAASDVTIGDAWAAVATLTRSPRLRVAAQSLHAVAATGQRPGDRMGDWPVFPMEFTIRYRTGEQTGQLDRSLADLSAEYQRHAEHALTFATILYPAVLFCTVAGGIIYAVVSFYGNYLKMLTKLGDPGG